MNLMWASTYLQLLEIAELKAVLVIHIHQTFHNLEKHIGWLCGHLLMVDTSSRGKMVHETARSFILNPENGLVITFDEAEAHKLAVVSQRERA